MLAETVRLGVDTGVVKSSSLQRLSVDTTVQPKAVAHPTDSRLYHKALEVLVRQAKRAGITLHQAARRLAKTAAIKSGRYAHARQYRRMKRELQRLRTYLGRVYRDVGRKIAGNETLQARFDRLLGLVERLLAQQPKDKNKLYALHAPEVACIAKSKARTPYGFGCKVGLAATNREDFVVAATAFEGNPYDGHTPAETLAQAEAMSGIAAERVYVDRGYRGHDVADKERVYVAGRKRGLTPTIRRLGEVLSTQPGAMADVATSKEVTTVYGDLLVHGLPPLRGYASATETLAARLDDAVAKGASELAGHADARALGRWAALEATARSVYEAQRDAFMIADHLDPPTMAEAQTRIARETIEQGNADTAEAARKLFRAARRKGERMAEHRLVIGILQVAGGLAALGAAASDAGMPAEEVAPTRPKSVPR
ncbi:hypothetical protein CKO28_05975 [Rhodovibrio sodomensis]|uniref:Transposase IS4-like domain-containing protein n=1 Tax=Rhodovibrio sodomensis TaxID=1088 RepID=A0ABS1DCG1_9PROT|nr:hypothetical protein [Rhodovibrio sodomensis]